jgi:hypothetical protein
LLLDNSGVGALTGGRGDVYARFLGERYKNRTNISYVLGGDRDPNSSDVTLWRSFARNLAIAANDGKTPDYSKTFCSYLPTGEQSSSRWFHTDEWLDFNIAQTHRHFHLVYPMVTADYNKKPPKPTVDGEPLYENHYNRPATAQEIRRQYWQWQLGGGFCVFGNNYVKGFLSAVRKWSDYLDTPGRKSFILMKKALTAKEWWKLVPDQSMISEGAGSPPEISVASRSSDGDFAFIYFESNKSLSINLSKLTAGGQITARWMHPGSGAEQSAGGPFSNNGTQSFKPPSGFDDAVLILETSR